MGKKLGMSQVFLDDGRAVPVTVIEAGPCTILQVKGDGKDGYRAVQLGFEDRKRHKASKAMMGIAKKAKTEPKKFVREVRLGRDENYELGQQLTVEILGDVKKVDVSGVTIGKGFQGPVKRWGFSGLPASHGTERKHRAPGSIGASATPSRVLKGHKMGGHMGRVRYTAKNLKVIKIDKDKNLLLVGGAVPGPAGGYVVVRESVGR